MAYRNSRLNRLSILHDDKILTIIIIIIIIMLCRFVRESVSGNGIKCLLMSIVVKSVLCAGIFELMPSKTCCVRLVGCLWNVMVETRVVGVQRDIRVDYVQYKAFCDFGWRADRVVLWVYRKKVL